MKGRRWWESPEFSVDGERRRFADSELDGWELDEELFENGELVVFRGELRLGEKRTGAIVIYPPAYDAGQQPIVVAPELDLGRHRDPSGALCLDHRVLGELAPMDGAEAVERAERLWHMWENDRILLHAEEADAPDPWGNYVDYSADSAVLLELPEQVGERGYLELAVQSLIPFRASLIGCFRQTHPTKLDIDLSEMPTSGLLGGRSRVQGIWQRLDRPPPDPRTAPLINWAHSEHGQLVGQARRYAEGHRGSEMPTLIGFVYPDEGPGRGETHDAWLFILIRSDGTVELPRPFSIRGDETWLRQPQLRELSKCSVAVVGVGALGSQIAGLLARAGIGEFVLVDPDFLTPGNRLRHELDLADIGRSKTKALADRLRRLNPWCTVGEHVHRFGYLGAPMLGAVQAIDDQVAHDILAADLVINATTDTAAGYHCAGLARRASRPVLHTWVSAGAWGARFLLQRDRPDPSGCTECMARWQADREEGISVDVEVPALWEDPDPQEVYDRGCADPSFTGPGFELTAAAAAGARVAIQVLAAQKQGSYPTPDFDLLTLKFRDESSADLTSIRSRLPVHRECSICNEWPEAVRS